MFGAQKSAMFYVDLETEDCFKWEGLGANASSGGKNIPEKEV
jgi:hypothetical protein